MSNLKTRFCAAIACAMLLCGLQPTYAAEQVQNLSVTQTAATGEVSVSGVHPSGKNMRISISVSVNNELFYRRELSTGEGGAFTVPYAMDYGTAEVAGDVSGKYTVTVGGAGLSSAVTTYPFVNTKDGVAIVVAANGATTFEQMKTVVETYGDACGFDLSESGDFYPLSGDGKQAIYMELAAVTNYTLTAEFISDFNRVKAIQCLNEGAAAQAEALVNKYKDDIGFDMGASSYYAKLATDEDKKSVCEAVVGKNLSLSLSDKSTAIKAFEAAVLTQLINETNTETRGNVITYLNAINDRGCGTISMDDYNSTYLTDTDRSDIIAALVERASQSPFTDVNDVKTEFEQLASDKLAEAKKPGKDNSSSGGGTTKRVSIAGGVATVVPSTQTVTPSVFSDVSETHWAAEAVNALYTRNIVNGTGDGAFSPDAQIKREEFVKLIVGALNLPEEDTEKVFTDVPEDTWFYPYVMKAYALNVVQGVDFDTFGAGENISREQMCAIIYRAMKLANINLETNDAQMTFVDSNDISDYAQTAVTALYRGGVINGMDGDTIAPKAAATRAMATKMIYTLMKKGGLL